MITKIAMKSFQEVQEVLLFCLEEEIIDVKEFVLLYEAYSPPNAKSSSK